MTYELRNWPALQSFPFARPSLMAGASKICTDKIKERINYLSINTLSQTAVSKGPSSIFFLPFLLLFSFHFSFVLAYCNVQCLSSFAIRYLFFCVLDFSFLLFLIHLYINGRIFLIYMIHKIMC